MRIGVLQGDTMSPWACHAKAEQFPLHPQGRNTVEQ